MDFEEVIKLERRLLDSSVRKSAEELLSLLSADFFEIGSSGRVYDRKAIIETLSEEIPYPVEAQDFNCVVLSLDLIQLRYKTIRTKSDAEIQAFMRSSIWKRAGEGWQMIFHQGTPTEP